MACSAPAGQGQAGGQNSGDAGGSHSIEAESNKLKAESLPPTAEAKRTYTASEKLACSIEAMRNGGECEACQ